MRNAEKNVPLERQDVREVLLAAASLGLPQIFNVEWLIDRAERGEWGGVWW